MIDLNSLRAELEKDKPAEVVVLIETMAAEINRQKRIVHCQKRIVENMKKEEARKEELKKREARFGHYRNEPEKITREE